LAQAIFEPTLFRYK